MILVEGNLLVWRQGGELVIGKAWPTGQKEIACHRIMGGRPCSVPALTQGRLYCRNNAGVVICVQLLAPVQRSESGG